MSLAPEISVIVPVYNDSAGIGKSVGALSDFIKSENLNIEIILINDGGGNKIAEIIAEKIKTNPAIKFIDRKINRGKGFSVREGFAAAGGRILIFTDADLPYGTGYFKKMIELMRAGRADLVIANRNLDKSAGGREKIYFLRKITHWGFAFLAKKLLGLSFSDTQAGLKGIKKEAAEKLLPKLAIDGFAFDLELLAAAKKANLKIVEIPVKLKNIGESSVSVFRDSFAMLKDIFKIRANH